MPHSSFPKNNKTVSQVKIQNIKNKPFDKDSVGQVMSTKIPTVLHTQTAGQVIDLLPFFAKKTDSINYVYILNKKGTLVGTISIKELFISPPEKKMKDIMSKNLITSRPQMDKEDVAYLAIKHNLKGVPVVNNKKQIIGALFSDKILSILYSEYRKSFHHFAGILTPSDNYKTILEDGIVKNFKSRIPWVIVGLVGGIFAAQIIELFEVTLTKSVILAAFIPLVVYISNAVGAQTQTFFVRDIAFNPKIKMNPYFIKQLISSMLIALVCSAASWLLIGLFWGSSYMGFIIGAAIFIAIFISTIIAILIPFILFKLDQDPALGSGPFATILQDLASVYIYFQTASLFL